MKPLFIRGAVVAVVMYLLRWLMSRASWSGDAAPSNEVEWVLAQKAVDILVESNKLLLGLATSVIAGLGAVVISKYQERRLSAKQKNTVIWTIVLCGVSLYSGYLCYENLIWMLSQKTIALESALVTWPSFWQFAAFLLAVLGLVQFTYEAVQTAEPKAGGGKNETKQ